MESLYEWLQIQELSWPRPWLSKTFTSDMMYLTFIECYYCLSGFHAFILFLCYTTSFLLVPEILGWEDAIIKRAAWWFTQSVLAEGDHNRVAKRPLSCPWVRWACLDWGRCNNDGCKKEDLHPLQSANIVKHILWANPGGGGRKSVRLGGGRGDSEYPITRTRCQHSRKHRCGLYHIWLETA